MLNGIKFCDLFSLVALIQNHVIADFHQNYFKISKVMHIGMKNIGGDFLSTNASTKKVVVDLSVLQNALQPRPSILLLDTKLHITKKVLAHIT